MTHRRNLLLAALAWPLLPRQAWSGNQPVRLIVPGDAGGVLDARARWLGPRLGAILDRPVIVENLPGASGMLAMRAARAGPKDASMIVMVHQGTLAVVPHLHADPGYDALADFQPLTRLGHGPLVIAVPTNSPISTLADLVKEGRRRTLSFSSPGVGTPPHLAGTLLSRFADIQSLHVPFKGGGQALTALVGGQVDFAVEGTTIIRPQVEAQRVKALAHTGATPPANWSALPSAGDVLKGFEYQSWTGLAVPAGTPPALTDRLHAALMQVLSVREAEAWFAASGALIGANSPHEFATYIRAEYSRWGRLLRDLGLTGQAFA